jgi:hypothetical protein
VAQKAAVNAGANSGITPQYVAAARCCKKVAELLIVSKAEGQPKSKAGLYALARCGVWGSQGDCRIAACQWSQQLATGPNLQYCLYCFGFKADITFTQFFVKESQFRSALIWVLSNAVHASQRGVSSLLEKAEGRETKEDCPLVRRSSFVRSNRRHM